MRITRQIMAFAVVAVLACGVRATAGNQLVQESGKDPVVLVHGYFGSVLGAVSVEGYWAYYITRLTIDGFDVYRIALPEAAMGDIKNSANELKGYVANVLAKTGKSKVDIICHSEGGLVSRYYIKYLGGDKYVDDLVTLATPHRGTTVASIGPGEAARQMEVYSGFLRELNSGDTLYGDVDYTAIFSNNDEMVFPTENGFMRGAVNANVNLLGHGGIMFNEDVYRIAKGAIMTDVPSGHSAVPVEIVKQSMTTNSASVALRLRDFNNNYTSADVKQMRVSNEKFMYGSSWEGFSSSKNWTLDQSADGLKAVYVQYRYGDSLLLGKKESPVYVDYVFLDRTAPTGGVDIVPATTLSADVDVKIKAEDNSDAFKTLKGWNFMIAYGIDELGVKEMMLSTRADFAGASWVPVSDSAKVSLGAGYGPKSVYLKLRDGAGNESPVYSDMVTVVDPSAPGISMVDEDGKEPVVLVHGYMGSIVGDVSSYINWVYIYEKLKAEGFDVHRITLDDAALGDVKKSAAQLSGFVADVLAKTGAKKVDIVCHSEGGLVARYYIQSLGGAVNVDDFVTFATPYRGTTVASIGPGEAARQMEVGSDFVAQLDAGGLLPGIEYTALFSNGDEIVVPGKNAFLKGALNINWNIFGHAGILFSQEPYSAMKAAISKKRVAAALPVKINEAGMVTSAGALDVSFTPYNHFDAGRAQTEMMVSLDPLFRGASWGPVTGAKSVSIAGEPDGMVGVHVKYRAAGGSESPSYVDYIVKDTKGPSGSVAIAAAGEGDEPVKLTLKAEDDADKYCCVNLTNLLKSYGLRGLGVREMQVSENADFAGAAWEAYAKDKTLALTSGAGQKTIYARFRDAAGNVSDTASVSTYRFGSGQGFVAAETGKEPVVLVHGYGAVMSDVTSYINWVYYIARLSADGFDPYVIALGDGALQDIAKSAAELSAFVNGVLAKTGAKKVDIVCHSEGGLVARYYMQKLGGASFVDDLVTISTPHRGTSVASIGPGDAGRQMEMGSDFLKALNGGDTTPGGVDYSAIFSNDDKTVYPPENAFYDGAVNMNANGYDHATILFNEETYKWVKNALGVNVGHAKDQLPVSMSAQRPTTSSSDVTLTLNYYNHNAPLDAPGMMMVSNDKNFAGAQWGPVAGSMPWKLESETDGLKAVYVKYKSAKGVESPAYVDYALLDRTAPSGSLSASMGADGETTVLISAADNTDKYAKLTLTNIRESYGITGAGVKEMKVSGNAGLADAVWEPYASSKVLKLAPDAKYVYAAFRDAAGNIGEALADVTKAGGTTDGGTADGGSTVVDAEMKLDAGWNLVYVPAGLPAEAVSALVAAAGNPRVEVFDAKDRVFRAAADALSGSGAVLWINAKSALAKTFAIDTGKVGTAPDSAALSAGWNVVGIPGFSEMDPGDAKVLVGADRILLDEAGAQGLLKPAFFEYNGTEYRKAEKLLPFRAYLVRAYKPCILSFR